LTWPFFIAPLIASEGFLAATAKSAAAEEEAAKAIQAGAAPQAANDDSPASDPPKTSAEDETTKGPSASSESHAAQSDPTVLLTPPHEDAPKPSTAPSEPVAAARGGGGGGGGGGGEHAGSRYQGPHTSIDDSSVNSLSADSNLGSNQMPGGSALESVQNVLGDSISPSIIGSASMLGTGGSLSNYVVDAIRPVEAVVQPVLTAETDTVGTLNDVVGTIAPLEAAVQPVLTTVTDTVGTLTNDVVGTIAPVEAAVQPVLMAVTDTVGTLTNDVVGTIAPVEAAVQPLLTIVTDTVDTLTNDVVGAIRPVDTMAVGTDAALPVVGDVFSLDGPIITGVIDPAHMGSLTGEVQSPVPDLFAGLAADTTGSAAPTVLDPIVAAGSSSTTHAQATAGMVVDGVNSVLAPPPGGDTDSSSHGDTSSVATHHIGSAGSVSGTGAPVLPDVGDVLQVAAPDTTSDSTDHAVASAAPVVVMADPLVAAMAGAASQSTTSSQTAASDSAGPHTFGSSAPALHIAEPAPATGNGTTADMAQPGNVASDAFANVESVADATESVLASAGVSLSNHAIDLLQPAVPDTGEAPGPAETLLALATAADAPIEVSGSATAAANIVTDISNAAAAVDGIAGDVIALNDVQLPPVNPLFTGTHYTDYGVTLSSEIAVPPQHAVSAADAASAQDTLVPVIADVQQHAPPPPDIVDTTHLIDHLGIREAIL
jgi:hypothetical protein